jgi:hypothetical protein
MYVEAKGSELSTISNIAASFDVSRSHLIDAKGETLEPP